MGKKGEGGVGMEVWRRDHRRYQKYIAILSSIGFVLSAYALYVELAKARDPSYQAMCDIASFISCSVVFTSEYGTGLGIVGKVLGDDSVFNQPNGVYGLFMYPMFLLSSVFMSPLLASFGIFLGAASLIVSVYLGYILFVVLQDICVICISSYIVNVLLYFCCLYNYYTIMAITAYEGDSNDRKKKK